MAPHELPKQYNHQEAQRRWSPFWQERGYFHSEPDPAREPYTIVIPPPNVTGALHLGHALNNTLQDILIRWRRMQGYNVLWMPGTDHAGIATQAVVERRLLEEEKKTRHDLGREALVARIWAWKNEYEKRILGQLEQLGASCDWRRTRFTLDAICARAVRHTFFNLFKERLIYRGNRLVNWDTLLQTAVSDDEVFHETVAGHFWHLRYPVIDARPGEPTFVSIATTRPETMLGDTAVAVHPNPAAALDEVEDGLRQKLNAAAEKDRPVVESQLADLVERRKTLLPHLERLRDMALAGRKVRLPLLDREIPLVADVWAKPELGSGCVKITPAHDPNDYEVAKRQGLPLINILNSDGTLNANAGAYQGLPSMQARKRVVADLESLDLVEKVEDREIELAHSDRSKTPIEPYLADQWFVKMDALAQSAMDAVIDGRVKIIPERYARGYLDWLSEKRDWPVSRQLWWGHRIPIWYAPTASEDDLRRAFAGRDDVAWYRDPEREQWLICAQEVDLSEDAVPGHKLTQEFDVLDTWFSSALWPHSTLGWPDDTPELRYYYPTSTLVTNRDILTLWVARMVLTGLFNMGQVPFRDVYIHPTILDSYGERMSKSKGNGVDPMDVIESVGADSLRFSLAYLTTETQDVRIPVEFQCPHCQALVEQTKKNRVLPRIECKKCGQLFATQWASKPADQALARGPVVSERFELGRNFCNKLWNASRFALLNLEGYTPAPVADQELAVEDRWLLSRLSTVTAQTTESLTAYRYAEAARVLYDFAWNEFCSFYVEMVKGRLQDPAQRPVAQRLLAHTLDTLLRLLHPFIPFITEEVWQRLGRAAPARGLDAMDAAAESVVIASWPVADVARQDPHIEARFAHFQEMLGELRKVRSQHNIPPKATLKFSVRAPSATIQLLQPMEPYFEALAGAMAIAWGTDVTAPPAATGFLVSGAEVFVDLSDHIDAKTEIVRQTKELTRLDGAIATKQRQLANADFLRRAPADVVAKERAQLAGLEEARAATQSSLAALQKVER
ncbi:MAG TPA: valine--tRNA ligase [Pirellulales bacterium]|nr:valine--tRNA ligase [Pirellulales bacterium]